MLQRWIGWLNLALIVGAILLIAGGAFFWLIRPTHFTVLEKAAPPPHLPPSSFAMKQEAYDAIKSPFISIQFTPASGQLPDLRNYILFYGKNGRPDATKENSLMHFAFTGNKTPFSVKAGEKIYLRYERNLNPKQYVLSPGNTETPLWFTAIDEGSQAQVTVTMQNEAGQLIVDPPAHHQFVVKEKEYAKHGGPAWELNGQRVDGTLLARQKSRWYGVDKFLERHGGEEYSELVGKQRIDFGEGEKTYSVYVGPSDSMAWIEGRWRSVEPGVESLGKPLLVVKRIDDRIMNLELWEPEGNGKMILNLVKATETWQPQTIQKQFKFVGARTRSQFIFEINKERLLLSPQDWLLLAPEGWNKLTGPDEIDAYVDRRISGPLFVFDGIETKEDRQVLSGTLFNSSRSDTFTIELPIQQGAATEIKTDKKTPSSDDEEEPESEDDLNDEDEEAGEL